MLGVSRDPVSLLSVWQKTGGQFLSSPQLHVLNLFRSALEGTADHPWRRGPPHPLSPTPTLKFFLPCYLSFSTTSVRTAPGISPTLSPCCYLFLPQHLQRGQLLAVVSTPALAGTSADSLPSRGRLSRPALRLLPSSGAWRPQRSKKG